MLKIDTVEIAEYTIRLIDTNPEAWYRIEVGGSPMSGRAMRAPVARECMRALAGYLADGFDEEIEFGIVEDPTKIEHGVEGHVCTDQNPRCVEHARDAAVWERRDQVLRYGRSGVRGKGPRT